MTFRNWGFRHGLIFLLAAGLLHIPARAASAQAWLVTEDVSSLSGFSDEYDGTATNEINTNFDLTNFTGVTLVGMQFTIIENAGTSYNAGEFEQFVFDTIPTPSTMDMSPWVPPSIPNFTGETFVLSNAGQTLTYSFPADPMTANEQGFFRFQIERPSTKLFDLQVTPIAIPEASSWAIAVLCGLCVAALLWRHSFRHTARQ